MHQQLCLHLLGLRHVHARFGLLKLPFRHLPAKRQCCDDAGQLPALPHGHLLRRKWRDGLFELRCRHFRREHGGIGVLDLSFWVVREHHGGLRLLPLCCRRLFVGSGCFLLGLWGGHLPAQQRLVWLCVLLLGHLLVVNRLFCLKLLHGLPRRSVLGERRQHLHQLPGRLLQPQLGGAVKLLRMRCWHFPKRHGGHGLPVVRGGHLLDRHRCFDLGHMRQLCVGELRGRRCFKLRKLLCRHLRGLGHGIVVWRLPWRHIPN